MVSTKNQQMLLQLAAAQLSLSLQETEKPVNELSKLFLEIILHHKEIDVLLSIKPTPDIHRLHDLHKEADDKIKSSVMNFLFYDRLCQRLHHILNNLQQAIYVLKTNENSEMEDPWEKILKNIEESYTIREEQALYQAIKDGSDFESAVQSLISKSKKQYITEGEIELF